MKKSDFFNPKIMPNFVSVENPIKWLLNTLIFLLLMMADVNVLWNNCLKVIKDNVSEEAYKTWFDPIVPLKYENNEFVVEVPSMFFYEYIEEKFAELLRLTLSREVGRVHVWCIVW